jgi:glycosyltransferase involved in cell wall biosynthesis
MLKQKIYICDINVRKKGHYIEFNQHILDSISDAEHRNPQLSFYFLFNSEAKELLEFSRLTEQRVRFIEGFESSSGFLAKLNMLKKVNKIVWEENADRLIFMDFDKYQIPLLMAKMRVPVSGILFRPHHRIANSNDTYPRIVASRITRTKKRVAEQLLLLNSSIDKIFILNDEEGVNYLNSKYGSKKFKHLVDPIFTYTKNSSDVITFENAEKPYRFLLFGALDERKNVSDIIAAYKLARFDRSTELCLVGKADQSYLDHLNSISTIANNLEYPAKRITIRPEFVTKEEMDNYFVSSDVCLLIYKNFYGSSGLLGRAALHKKKIIGANVGLISELTRRYKLGLLCDPHDVEGIAQALSEIMFFQMDKVLCWQYSEQHSPNLFLKSLLNLES